MSVYFHSRKKTAILSACAAVGAFALAGCGGGSDGGSSSGSNPIQQVQTGQTDINSIVRGSSSNELTSLQDAVTNFNNARNASPTNKDAQTGYAISQAALAGIQFTNVLGASSFALKANATGAQARLSRLAQASNALAIWNAPKLLGGSAKLPLPTASDLIPSVPHATGTLTAAQIQATLTTLDAHLASAESALALPLSDPNYVFLIADPSQPNSTTATVKVGAAELRTLAALIAVLRSVTNVGTAYNADPGTFNYSADVHTLSSFTLNSTIPAATFLPGGTFATLNSDGATRLSTVKSELQATITDAVDAVQSVKTRTNAGYLLDPGTLVTTQQLTDFQTQAQSYQPYLTGPQSITLNTTNLGTITVVVNLNAWFTNAPHDLKAFLPPLKVTASSGGNATLTAQALPSPTFGGLFPSGVPTGTFSGTIDVTPGETVDQFDSALLSL